MKYITCSETASLVRGELKKKFPGTKFYVHSKSYSGGASITVRWIDGASETAVDKIVGKFEGAVFDGMIDLKSHVTGRLNGEDVHFGADFIFTERSYSRPVVQKIANDVCARFHDAPVNVLDSTCWISDKIQIPSAYVEQDYKRDHINREIHYTLQKTSF